MQTCQLSGESHGFNSGLKVSRASCSNSLGYRGGGSSLRVVRFTGGSRIADSRPVAVRAKDKEARGGLGARKFLNFRSSEIDSGAFWDDFQHCKARIQTAIAAANLFCIYAHAEQSIELCPNLDLIPAAP